MAINEQTGEYIATPQQTVTAPPPPTAATVYSAPNVTQTVTAPVAAPNLSDPMGIYDYYTGSADVTAARDAAAAASQARQQAADTARQRQLAIEQNPLESMQYIVGAQSRAGQLDAAQLQALAEAEGVAQSAYQAKLTTAKEKAQLAINQREELTRLITSNPGAGISYTDTPESAAKKIEKYGKEQEKKAYKDKLKETALSLGLKTKGKNTKDLEKAIAKKYKEQGKSKEEMDALEKKLKQKELAKPYYEPDKAEEINIDKSDKGIANLVEEGVNSGDSWADIAATLTAAGINTSSGSIADKLLRYKFGVDSSNPLDL